MFGFVNLNKPPGPTSHDMVATIRRRLPRKTRIGHAGTLDPFASGVLVLCIGRATRLAEFVQNAPKRYRTVIELGATSTTDDPTGERTQTAPAPPPPAERVGQVIGEFLGDIEQTPPAHSAVHVDGQRAYQLARAGQNPQLKARTVTVHAIDILRYDYPLLELDIRCGCGTYIRSIARDVGQTLGTGGLCKTLQRTAIGDFTINQARDPHDIDLPADLRNPAEVIDLPKITVAPSHLPAISQGKPLEVETDLTPESPAALLDETGRLIAIAQLDQTRLLRPKKVFL
jgi:tRNA pseudouridine55 synthase